MTPGPDPIAALRAAVADAAAELHGSGAVQEPTFERPPRPDFGDFSTNAAMLAAPLLGRNPREVAGDLGELIRERLGAEVERVEVAGPGFLNLFVTDAWLREAAAAVTGAGEGFGSGGAADRRQKIMVEFVSANPTGPITVASARHAAYGDSLARVFDFAGHDVSREYYVNDAGRQIRLFGESLAARMTGGEVPEGGYEGDYVTVLAERLAAEGAAPDDVDALAKRGVEAMLESISASLRGFRVEFDRWSSERELREAGAVEAAIELLREKGVVYESEGAVWLRTTDFGDDKDRVLIRADGEGTYFSGDIAYHRDKLERGFELMIAVLGADHHGYVARMKAAVEALGAPPGAYEAPIMQLVHLVEGGSRAQMSKRRGEFATLDELVGDIGVDAARFFLLQRSHDTTIDIDLDLARSRERDNPVYYVQYAHARICNIAAKAAERGIGLEAAADAGEPIAVEPSERALICRLLELPAQVRRAELRREPHGLGAYAREVAADFAAFYRDCPVLQAEPEVRAARFEVCEATRIVIATTLGLLGVGAPEEM
jgi:arginyl-tRNA synthetase